MKKLAAILLLAVFAFNLFGYKLYSYLAEQKANEYLTTVLETNSYADEDLLLVTKSINLPYYNNTTEFTSAEGETEINGTYYRYVKYRINNNMLEMLCLPNTEKTKILQAKSDYFNFAADIEKKSGDGKNSKTPAASLKKAFSDFEENTAFILSTLVTNRILSYHNYNTASIHLLSKEVAEQPPEFFV